MAQPLPAPAAAVAAPSPSPPPAPRLFSIDGAPDWLLQVPAAQSRPPPHAPHCLWERSLHDAPGVSVGPGVPVDFMQAQTAGRALGLGFVLVSRERILARMRVDERHQQPMGLLHGGVSALVAEELGSIGASLSASDRAGHPVPVVGISVQATHMAGATVGDLLICEARPVKGRGKLQVWSVDIYTDTEENDAAGVHVGAQQSDMNSATVSSRALHYRDWRPTGKHVATCQLTTLAQSKRKDNSAKHQPAPASPPISKL